ncbi:hypothetical protein [Microbacterium imperiale]|uniref:Uncharacterized protein n=1 Tax=Microbacterium imperiale TaxID=33884 RepID=A0A9W6HGD4_9MICO|nr:hypothetical protein [Microbacterium imperiale]MBP2420692.1 hypothetical protein [Microbacterium imperiale]MDS0200513.1 hypothetical protein [Microbacterium imperiale]BFE41032.1 hypothetical protein GCM10017544_19880 [Microbacterium imperiale]GLJ80001.1 hypothetical protein GCM10017586_16840 [Microbacterium imperiale]
MTASRVPGPARIDPAIPIAASGLSPRGRLIAALLTAALLLTATAGVAAAGALPTFGTRTTSTAHGSVAEAGAERRSAQPIISGGEVATVVEAQWNGPAIHLDWHGVPYARAETSFIGDRVVVPGDRTVRTLDVVNAGPADAVMTVTMDFDEQVPAAANNPRLGEDITIFWEIAGISGRQSFSALAADRRVEIAELALNRDETAHITVGFEMPRETRGSRSLGAESTLLRFDVGVEMRGETGAGGPRPPALAVSGGQLALAAIAAAIALTLLGLLVLALRRRDHRCDDCDRSIPSDERRITVRSPQQRPETLCRECACEQVLG